MAGQLRRLILQALFVLLLGFALWRSGSRLLASGPAAGSPKAARVATAKDAGVALPSGWPVPELTVPENAAPARLNAEATPGGPDAEGHYPWFLNGVPFNSGGQDSGRIYGVGLRIEGGFEALAGHVESQLGPLGYSEHWNSISPDGSHGREYISPDRMYVVQIYFWAESRDCHLEVYAYDNAENGKGKSGGKALS